jgi:hypothetical protein
VCRRFEHVASRRGGEFILTRSFRYYEKKRGHRRTGSSKLGRAGELIFFGSFCLLGIGGLTVLLAIAFLPEWRVNHEFVEHPCAVLDTRVKEIEGAEGPLYRPEVEIEYTVDGVTYRAWTYDIATALNAGDSYASASRKEAQQAILAPFAALKQAPCWFDPNDPNIVVLVRGYSGWVWLVAIVPVSFMLIGAGGFVYAVLHWGRSAEYCAAITQRVQERDLFGTNGHSEHKFPTIPDGANIVNSPGTKLKFRLPVAASPGWALFGTLLACVLWNGIVTAFVVFAVRSYMDGHPDWLLTVFVVSFGAVGIGLIVLFVRQILIAAGIGPTLIEISHHPLVPGGAYHLYLFQSGRLAFQSLDVALVCKEHATYRQGTNTRTEARPVYRQQLFRRENFEVQGGLPFEAQCDFRLPAGAMHSFRAGHNEISWTVVVKGDTIGWPAYERSFPVIIVPANGRSGT